MQEKKKISTPEAINMPHKNVFLTHAFFTVLASRSRFLQMPITINNEVII